MKNCIPFVLFLLAAYSCVSQSNLEKESSLLWEVSGNGLEAPSYLFGTYHLATDRFLKNWPMVLDAFKKVEGIVVETVVDSSQIPQAMAYARAENGDASAYLDSANYFIVDQECQKSMGIPLSSFNGMKPIIVAISLTLTYNREVYTISGELEGVPMDLYFSEEGKRSGKEVYGLESLLEQSEMLYRGQSEEQQAKDLIEMIKDKEEAIRVTTAIVESYSNNNYRELALIGEEDHDTWGNMDHLLKDRNARWLEEIPLILRKQSTFIAVGALHLAGEEGLIAGLKSAGYSVKPIPVK